MKALFTAMAQMAGGLFLMVAVGSLLNASLGWHLGFKGQVFPSDYAFAALFAGLGIALVGGVFLLQRRQLAATPTA